MDKHEIILKLKDSHRLFIDYLTSLDDRAFMYSFQDEKWTAGQQADHIYRSLMPVHLILKFPKWTIKQLLGTANRPSKSYDELVAKYYNKLENRTGTPPKFFTPKEITVAIKPIIFAKVQNNLNKICNSLEGFTEEELDELILPQPLLGKVTLREMMYFTIFHVQHHQKITERNLLNFI
ncbi:MAG: DinB family protein [Bacteroidetes bacterium]|nr:DinB family protein [Bacteroidota bacterium]